MSERLIWRYPPPPTQAEHSNLLSIGPLCPRLATANTTKILPLNLNNKINSTECSSDRILEIQRRFSELQTIYGLSVRSGNPIRPMCFTNFYREILSILTLDGSWNMFDSPKDDSEPHYLFAPLFCWACWTNLQFISYHNDLRRPCSPPQWPVYTLSVCPTADMT